MKVSYINLSVVRVQEKVMSLYRARLHALAVYCTILYAE